jgi:hypothetical protein
MGVRNQNAMGLGKNKLEQLAMPQECFGNKPEHHGDLLL